MDLKAKLSLEDIQDADNIATLLDDKDLEKIGHTVCEWYQTDLHSRQRWEKKMEGAMELALQITKEKTWPWRNASNVKFPLLTIASLQFASRAYPALVKAPNLVKYRVQGADRDGQKAARAARISAHMSYQLLEQDEQWEEGQDKALLALPILGCVFKKSYYNSVDRHNCSKLVLPKSLVVNYYAKSIEDAERKTEVFELYTREIRERELRGLFKEHEYGPPSIKDEAPADKRQGTSTPPNDESTPRIFLESHCYLDLDGDGYKEPYVVTVDNDTKKVARIVARIASYTTEQSLKVEEIQKRMRALAEGVQNTQNPSPDQQVQAARVLTALEEMDAEIQALLAEKPKVLRIEPVEHYTKYSFIPSPDGGFYDLGFGQLLGPINSSVDTLINQLIDSGTLNNSSSGFLGKGARIKGGKVRFEPFEWKRVNVAGSALKDSIVPLPINPPSPVLFQLLGLLINYAERVGSVTDTMVGENPGQNTPAYNMSAMLEQGLQVFNGIFKRTYRSFRSELRKLYNLNAIYLDSEEYFTYHDSDSQILRVDYTSDTKDLIPAADPNAFSNKEKLMKAQAVAERAAMVPGYNPIEIEKRLLESLDIPDSDAVFPTQVNEETGAVEYVFPPQPDPELEIEKADMQRRVLEGQSRAEKDMLLAQSKVNVDEASIIKLMADAAKTADEPELERLSLLLEEQKDIRKNLVEMAKIDEARANRGMDGESGNGASS
jgi:chaperonin GroES